MYINFSVFNPIDGTYTETINQQPTLHNGKAWYCFDEPTCQEVVYWSNSGTYTNMWVYSVAGLNGAATSFLDNDGADYPLSSGVLLGEDTYTWTNLLETEGINSSLATFVVSSSSCTSVDNFQDCINELSQYFPQPEFFLMMDVGIVEDGSVQGSSEFCKIKDVLLELDPTLTPTQIAEWYLAILNAGIIVDAGVNCNGIITSIETYLKYAEAVGTTP